MSLNRSTAFIALMALLSCGISPRPAQAGPLLDWLFGRSNTAPITPVGAPVPVGNGYAGGNGYAAAVQPAGGALPAASYATGYAGNYGTYYSTQLPAIGPAGAGYTAPMPTGIAAATLPASMPPTLSYVPNFQTQSQRTPVTYYRPLMTTDPNTGAQVVAMAPCTSYEMMAQRVPAAGRSALFGSSAAPAFQPPAQTLPTYTLPSGGVPLAYSAPSITAPYSTAYGVYGSTNGGGSYSTLQPGTVPAASGAAAIAPSGVGPSGAYPTAPLVQTPYYGTHSGGSCGELGATPWQPVPGGAPGLVAPQAPPPQYPSPSSPSFSQPEYSPAPSGSAHPPTNAPPGIYPPSGGASSDPADVPPSLPSTDTSAAAGPQFNSLHADSSQASQRPQLRSIVRYPGSPSQSADNASQSQAAVTPSDSSRESRRENHDIRSDVPAMLPIPAPQDFHHEPRWNPGLLREEDMTALRPIDARAAQLAGHAKPIVWASFEAPSRTDKQRQLAGQHGSLELPSMHGQATPSGVAEHHSSSHQLRRIVNSAVESAEVQSSAQPPVAIQRLPASRLMPVQDESTGVSRPQRDASGWKATR